MKYNYFAPVVDIIVIVLTFYVVFILQYSGWWFLVTFMVIGSTGRYIVK